MTPRRWNDARTWIIAVIAMVAVRPVCADYLLYAVTDGCTAADIDAGDTLDVQLWLLSDNQDTSNSIIVQLAFSPAGVQYNGLTWHGVYAGSMYDDSTPNSFPQMVTVDVLSGPGHPPGIADVELSNVAIDPYCVGADNVGAGACECPGGRCIGQRCVGGAFNGATCTAACPVGASCTNRFREGLLATLSLTVPLGFAADFIELQPIVDTVANGFNEINTAAPEPLRLYLACIVPGDADCDARVTLTDYDDWNGCVTGPGGGVPPACDVFNFDGDDDIDVLDWSALQRAFDLTCVP